MSSQVKKKSPRTRTWFFRLYAQDKRLFSLLCFVVVLFSLVAWRLGTLQLMNHSFYNALASGQYEVYKELFPERGSIFLQNTLLSETERYKRENLFPAATNRKYWQIYAVPYDVSEPARAATELTNVLFNEAEIRNNFEVEEGVVPVDEKVIAAEIVLAKDQYRNKLLERFSKKNDPYEPIYRKATDEQRTQVEAMSLQGVHFAQEYHRYYPEKNLGSHIVGFVGTSESEKIQGLYGTEYYFEDELAGLQGYLNSEQDVGGRLITVSDTDFQAAVDGADVILTIDQTLQNFVCQRLNAALETYEAQSGSIVVMHPKTGEVLAMCSAPDFDPNAFGEVDDVAIYNNQAVFSAYEPGSIFKPITMSAGIDMGKITPQTTYFDEGQVKVGGFTIKNFDGKGHGEKTMVEVLNQSLNTGTIFVVDQIGRESFVDYVKKFAFGARTNIHLPSENPGDINQLINSDGIIYAYTASFGQGITVTPLQMVRAFAAMANGGVMVEPHIIDRIVYSNGFVEETSVKEIGQVISKRTASLISGMLVSVVVDGHGARAAVPGYHIAGKTGTAQIAEGGEYTDATIQSFVGYGPVEDPVFSMIVRLDKPEKSSASSASAVLVFGEIAKFLLGYYQIPPSVE